jgi:hypothetical protein
MDIATTAPEAVLSRFADIIDTLRTHHAASLLESDCGSGFALLELPTSLDAIHQRLVKGVYRAPVDVAEDLRRFLLFWRDHHPQQDAAAAACKELFEEFCRLQDERGITEAWELVEGARRQAQVRWYIDTFMPYPANQRAGHPVCQVLS